MTEVVRDTCRLPIAPVNQRGGAAPIHADPQRASRRELGPRLRADVPALPLRGNSIRPLHDRQIRATREHAQGKRGRTSSKPGTTGVVD
jgi:hypothetical protein